MLRDITTLSDIRIHRMASVTLKDLSKTYRDPSGKDIVALDKINLEIKDREFMVLVGPSGCGKSTALRLIAGLEQPTSGEILMGNRSIQHIEASKRDLAMVFQNYALYPHLRVFQNMSFGLNLIKMPRAEIDKRVRDAAALLGITDLLQRRPQELSGGQKQRVALGRALVRQPRVFLFDEPLSNLDAKLRSTMRSEISKLHARLATTMIYVTHDQVEAMTMGDRITVMNQGQVMQIGDPLTLYHQPANRFVASFIGSPSMNFISGMIQRRDNDFYFEEDNTRSTRIRLKLPPRLSRIAQDYLNRVLILGIRPEDLYDAINTGKRDSSNIIRAILEVEESMGPETYLYLSTGAQSFVVRTEDQQSYPINAEIRIRVDLDRAHLFDPQTDQNLSLQVFDI